MRAVSANCRLAVLMLGGALGPMHGPAVRIDVIAFRIGTSGPRGCAGGREKGKSDEADDREFDHAENTF